MCCGQPLVYTDVYKYLGVLFQEHLQEKKTVEALTNAATKSFGRITNIFKEIKNMGIKSYETLYESYIIPILNYGAGVWGFAEQTQPQVLQNRMKRYYMGVNKFAPNSALGLEFGWLDVKFRRWLEIARYWNRLCEMSENRWPKSVVKWDISLKASGWADQLGQILDLAGMSRDMTKFEKVDLDVLEKNLLKHNEHRWLLEAYSKSKLRTYIHLYDPDTTRDIVTANLSRPARSIVTKLKIGVLPLHLETGRWKDTPLENRTCRTCDDELLESELHFLMHCDALKDERSEMYRELLSRTEFEIRGDEIQQMKDLLGKNVLKITGKHLLTMFERRREILYETMTADENVE